MSATAAGDVLRQSRAWRIREASDQDARAANMEKDATAARAKAVELRDQALNLAHAIRVLEGPNAPIDIPAELDQDRVPDLARPAPPTHKGIAP